jgi:hypothetical protein
MYGFTNNDISLIKTTLNGDTVWCKFYGAEGIDLAASVRETNDNGFVIVGSSNSFSANGDKDIYVIKTDQAGNTMWSRTYGGYDLDEGVSIELTASGYIVSGITKSFGAGGEDMYLLCLTSSGDIVWSRTYGGSGDDYMSGAKVTQDGGFFLVGTIPEKESITQSTNISVIRTDSLGGPLWVKEYGGTESEYATASSMTATGGIVITGGAFDQGNENMFILNVNSQGNIQFSYVFDGGGRDIGYSIMSITANEYIIGGESEVTGDQINGSLVCIDSTGNIKWYSSVGGQNNDVITDVTSCINGDLVLTGYTFSFGSGSQDLYLARTSPLGHTSCSALSIFAVADTAGFTVQQPINFLSFGAEFQAVDVYFDLYSGENTFTRCYYNPPTHLISQHINIDSTTYVNSAHDLDDSYKQVNVITPILSDKPFSMNVFPNPSQGDKISISLTGMLAEEEVSVVIYDALGREEYSNAHSMESGENVYLISLSGQLSPGVYMMVATTKRGTDNKIIVVN